MKGIWSTVTAGLLLLAPAAAVAQEYPNRNVKVLVAFPAGGSADIVARIVAQPLAETEPALRGREPPGRRWKHRLPGCCES